MLAAFLVAVCAQVDAPFPDRYQEPYANSHAIRQEQYTQLNQYIDHLMQLAPERRADFFVPDYASVEAYTASVEPYRAALKARLGFPPAGSVEDAAPRIEALGADAYADIYRVWTPVLAGVDAYGLLFVPRDVKDKAPLLICQHGGGGSPEVVSVFEGPGNYGWMVQRGLQAGFICYAPSLIFPLGGTEEFEGPGRKSIDERLRYVGTSLLAVEVFKITRAIDMLIQREDVDADRIGMVGLSYGGCYTLYTAALDTRIKAAVSSCYFNDRAQYAWADWSYANMLNEFTDPELVGLICPRALMVEVGINDELFSIDGARATAPAAQAHYERLGIPERFQFVPFEGAHEFRGDTAYEFLNEHVEDDSCSYCPPHK
jgi:hypothetical protein